MQPEGSREAASRPFCFFIKGGLQVLGQEAGPEGQRTLGGSQRSGTGRGCRGRRKGFPCPSEGLGGKKARAAFFSHRTGARHAGRLL